MKLFYLFLQYKYLKSFPEYFILANPQKSDPLHKIMSLGIYYSTKFLICLYKPEIFLMKIICTTV